MPPKRPLDLEQPLPQGSRRRGRSPPTAPPSTHVPTPPLSSPSQAQNDNPPKRRSISRTAVDREIRELPDELNVFFDGGCRGNGTTNARSAAGVYVDSPLRYDSTLCVAKLCPEHVNTNQTAELFAAIELTDLLLRLVSVRTFRKVSAYGDANYVISMVVSGRLLQFEPYCKLPNAALWHKLKVNVDQLHTAGQTVHWQWVPRLRNRESDELVNSALDARPPNPAIRSVAAAVSLSLSPLIQLLEVMQSHRFRTLRTLPASLDHLWTSVIETFITRHEHDAPLLRLLLWAAPVLLSQGQSAVRNRTNFKALRCHLVLLHNEEYLADVISDAVHNGALSDSSSEPPAPTPPDVAKVVATLCARGLPDKCLGDDSVTATTPTPTVCAAFAALFPASPLPEPIEVDEHSKAAAVVSFAAIYRAFRRLKRGTAPGICGWSAELLRPLFLHPSSTARNAWSRLFCAITANNLLPVESALFNTAVGIPLWQTLKEKLRPVQLLPTFRKIAWRLSLEDKLLTDPGLKQTGQAAFLAGSSQTAVHALQSAAQAGFTIVSADGVNAYNTASRAATRQHVYFYRSHYANVLGLYNLTYCTPSSCKLFDRSGCLVKTIDVSSGSAQGCVSASWAFATATCNCLKAVPSQAIAIVDDTYFIHESPTEALRIADTHLARLSAECGIRFHKHAILTPSPIPPSTIPASLASADISHSTLKALGVFIAFPHAQPNDILAALAPIKQKVDAKFRRMKALITACAPKQCLWQVLVALARHFTFHARCLPPATSEALFNHIDESILAFATSILPAHVPLSHQVHTVLQTPIGEHGGLGIMPYTLVRHHMYAAAALVAAPFVLRLALPPLPLTGVPDSSLVSSWKRLTRPDPAQSSPLTHSPQWIGQWPATQATRLSDDEFDFFIGVHLGFLEPKSYACPIKSIDIGTLSPEHYCTHVLNCKHCGAPAFHVRHESVNNTLHRTFRRHGIVSSLNPPDLPRPDSSRGGPDQVVYHSEITAIDVAVTSEKYLVARDTFKLRLYADFSARTTFAVLPWVMTHKGNHSKRCLAAARTFARNVEPSLYHELLTLTTFALLRGQLQGVAHLHARTKLTTVNNELTHHDMDEEFVEALGLSTLPSS